MRYNEYGNKNKEVIILLHGGGLSWWNYEDVANILKNDYHIILPIFDGHAGSNHSFVSIEENASKIIEFIDQNYNGKVLLIGGLSLGGQIALEILSQRGDICQYAIIESALVLPSKITHHLIKPTFGTCFGLIKYKWFSKLQFKALKIKDNLFEQYYQDTCAISKENMIAFLEANTIYCLKDSIKECFAKVYICVGQKESYKMHQSALLIHKALKNSQLEVIPSLYHGEFSINQSQAYANKLLSMIHNNE